MVDPASDSAEQKSQLTCVTFDETVKGNATDKGGQDDQLTQYDEVEEEHPTEASNSSQTCPSLTQVTTNKDLYGDKSTRGSINRPYVLGNKKENGADRIVPLHFFETADGTSTITLGTANRENHECDVRLDELSAKGHKMNKFGLSNRGFLITYDEGTEELQLTGTNGGPLSFYQKHTGRAW